jgi:hypothetical protein
MTAPEISKACSSGTVRSQGKRKGKLVHAEDLAKYKVEKVKKQEERGDRIDRIVSR